MNLVPLTPLFTVLVVSSLARLHFKTVNRATLGLYKNNPALVYVILIPTVFFASIPIWVPSSISGDDIFDRFVMPIGVSAVSILAFIWARNFRIIMNSKSMIFGSFRQVTIAYDEITELKLRGSTVKGRLQLTIKSGKKFYFYSSLESFKHLIIDLLNHTSLKLKFQGKQWPIDQDLN